ncbi:MAG: radical SAM protein [Myxococcales bacterium]|nr:radical SAM protein [Myxococcales bacterium]
MRARVEDFGAWVRLDDRTLVAVDRRRAAGLGLAGPWSGPQPADIRGPTAPLEAHVAITERCPLSCAGCYQPTRVDGAHASLDRLRATLDEVRAAGAFMVAFGGGEPLTHPDLPALAREARARDLVPVVTTSGIGLTAERARALSAFAQVNVSYDGATSELRARETVAVAERAIAALVGAGVTVGVNVVLTRRSVVALEDTCARAAALGAVEAQLLRYKPEGRARSLDYLERRLSPAQVAELPALLRRIVDRGALSLRVDCALVPLLSFADAAALDALAVMGCEAGNALTARTLEGRVAPCSFTRELEPAALTKFADTPEEPCASCPIQRVCRGGCKVVSTHLDGRVGPDPECPRVIAHRSRA